MDITYFDYRLRCLVEFADEGAELLVVTEGERSQVERLIKFYERPDLTIRFEDRKGYDGGRFLIEIE